MPKTKKLKEASEKYVTHRKDSAKDQTSNRVAQQKRAITTTEIRRNLNGVIQRVRTRHEHAIIEKSGAPVAVLLSVPEYEQLLKYKRLATFDRLSREIGEQVEQRGLSEQELMTELEETKRQVFQETYAGIS